MLVKCHQHLHPLVSLDTNCANQNIFEQVTDINELAEELVKGELLVFNRYQLDIKDIKCPLQLWQKHEAMLSTIGFLTWHTLGVVEFQIETKIYLLLVGIFTNLRKHLLQTENLEMLIFINKNWPNDLRICCKFPSNLLKFLEKNLDLKEKF